MKILITGAYGQLGRALQHRLSDDPDIQIVATDSDTLDITDREAIGPFLADAGFDVIINCAAYTAVDLAEKQDLLAARINTEAVRYLAEAARKHRIRVIHISTDYVFSGENCRPYAESDEPYPHSIYGRTKLEGEGVLTAFCPDSIILRTSWLYSEHGNNFVLTMLRQAEEKPELRVVCDQIGTPTYAGDLADAIYTILKSGKWVAGIFNFTDEGVASWYDFAKAIFYYTDRDIKVVPVSSSEYRTAATRPLYSVLNKAKIKRVYGLEIPYWHDSLRKCLSNLKKI
ncbi:MAG: dTDP-4-dehydrorhamnose reductase [Muribaculaceae bacterium]|nr:dTDP-4-dehydrorhamnose reductase [Muribaculaceae bacterium]